MVPPRARRRVRTERCPAWEHSLGRGRAGPSAQPPPADYSPQPAPRLAASTAPCYWPPLSRPPMGRGYVGRRRKGSGALRSGGSVRVGGAAGRGVPCARPAGMGGSESSHGGRKVSFGLDEREQVRVLQGIRVRRPAGVRGPGDGGGEAAGDGGAGGQGAGRGRALLGRRCWRRSGRGCGTGLEGVSEENRQGRGEGKLEGVGGRRGDGMTGERWAEGWVPEHGLSRGGPPALHLPFRALLSPLSLLAAERPRLAPPGLGGQVDAPAWL